jgi:O-antigen/teichoic acid export membrane protein
VVRSYLSKKILVYPVKYRVFSFSNLKDEITFGSITLINSISRIIYWQSDYLIISLMIDSKSIAVYSVGVTIAEIFKSFSTAISSPFIPKVFKLSIKMNSELFELLTKVGKLQYFVLLLVCSGFYLFGEKFTVFWFGEEYRIAYFIALMLMVSQIVPLTQNLWITVLQSLNKHKFRSYLYFLISLSNIFLTVYSIDNYGIIGASVSTSLSFIVGNLIIMNIYYRHIFNNSNQLFFKNVMLKISLSTTILIFLFKIILQHLKIDDIGSLVIMMFIYFLTYIVVNLLFTLNRHEKNEIYNFLGW